MFLRLVSEACPLPAFHLRSRPSDVRSNRPGQARAPFSTSTQWRSDMDTPVTTIETPARKAPPAPRNGVDTPKLFATIGAVASQPALAQFRFRGQSHWVGGTQSRTTIAGFYGVGAEMQHDAPFQASADHPKGTMRRGQCTRSGRMGAARACGVPHCGHREYLRGAGRHPSFGGMQRRR